MITRGRKAGMFSSPFFSRGIYRLTRWCHLRARHTAADEQFRYIDEMGAGSRNVCQQRQYLSLVFVVIFACCLGSRAWGQDGASTQQSIEAQRRAAEEVEKLNQRVTTLYHQGEYVQACEIAKQALRLAETSLGPKHPGTAQSLTNLGGLYQVMGQYEQALPLYQQALAIWEKIPGSEQPGMAVNLDNLGGLYQA